MTRYRWILWMALWPVAGCTRGLPGEDTQREASVPVDAARGWDLAQWDLRGGADAAPDLADSACRRRGGTCVPGRWAQCPAGTQPTEDIHADCMPPGASRGYFCCVPAPPSPCADAANQMTDCFAGKCEACWAPATGPSAPTCAGGRTCCFYACPD